ncbi:MAG: TIGR04282 family arsenosugar biosynthesis glycosyltransferase [Elusimicrobiales bacterium]|nr:TIGR04282 family arsenosugar biosynthesis glycosyltransferase [Elusimicrobiales bacterium]
MPAENKRRALILFCRYPRPGRVKTRLAAGIGTEAAATLYACFLRDLAATASRCGARRYVFHTPPRADGKALKKLLGVSADYICQRGSDLGARMDSAFKRVFREGAAAAVIIGSDSPDLGVPELKKAFSRLADRGAVIGPAFDGGYYLLGFRRGDYMPEVFTGITWSGPEVYEDTLRKLKSAAITTAILRRRHDVDTLADLQTFRRRNKARRGRAPLTMKALACGIKALGKDSS